MTRQERALRRVQLVESVRSGRTVADVAREAGVTYAFVYSACIGAGVSPPMQNWKCDPIVILGEIVSHPDLPIPEIARRHGLTRQRVYQIRRRAIEAGILLPSTGGVRMPLALTDPTRARLRAESDRRGISVDAVAEQMLRRSFERLDRRSAERDAAR